MFYAFEASRLNRDTNGNYYSYVALPRIEWPALTFGLL